MPREKLQISNNAALFGWAFMLVWMAMLAVFTWLALRDGGIPGYSALFSAAVLGVFWLFGVAGSRYFFAMPRVRLAASPQELIVEEIWLWKRRITTLAPADASRIAITDDRDSEGDPYFKCEITVEEDRRIVVKESHIRDLVEAAQAAILDALAPDQQT